MAKKRKCDQWPDLCELVKNDDGLPVNAYGPWTEEKLRFWHRYVDITTSSMVGHPRWQAGLVYVDLFTGSGVCKIDETGKRLPGSPLIAACAEKPFREIRLCELDHDRADACEKRVRQFAPNSDVKLFKGDCNQKIDEITTGIPQGALTLAFIDPEGLDVEFETIRILASRCRADLLILVADAIDFVRNVSMYITQAESKADRFLGPDSNWRNEWQAMGNVDGPKARNFLANKYMKQLERLGYVEFRDKTIRSKNGPLYRLIFASNHERGGEFWDKVTRKNAEGQRDLPFS